MPTDQSSVRDGTSRTREQALEGVSWSGHLDEVVSLHDYDVLDMFVTDWEAVDGVSHKGEPTDGTVYVVRLDLHTGKLIPPPVGKSGGSDLRGLHYDQLIYRSRASRLPVPAPVPSSGCYYCVRVP